MAIAYDATSTFNSKTPGTGPLTYSHTCTGSNGLLLVFINISSSTAITGVTYNGVAMSLVGSYTYTASEYNAIYGLLSPSTGSNTVSIAYSGSQYIRSGSVSYTGVKQTGLPDATGGTGAGSGTSISTTVTTVANNCWVAGIVFANNGDTLSAGSGFTSRLTSSGFLLEDTNSPKTPAGNVTFAASWTTSAYNYCAAVSFAPSGPTLIAGTGTFTLTGNNVNLLRSLIMSTTVGSFVLTGIDVILNKGYSLIASAGSFILTGVDVMLKFKGWRYNSKSSTTWTQNNKSSTTWNYTNKS